MKIEPKRLKRVHLISLGCAKNRIDTETILGQLFKAGFMVVHDPIESELVIVNTCGFLKSARKEALDEISRLAALKKRRSFILAVTGCLVQITGKSLRQLIPQIDILTGVYGYSNFAHSIDKKLSNIPVKPCNYSTRHYLDRVLTTGPCWAYLRIADGCDNRCSYCLIPKIRGPFRSRPMAHIIAEAHELVKRGVREINLIAQDTTNYGVDIYKRPTLPDLLRKLEKIKGLRWIRILYTHPAHYNDELIETIAGSDKIVKYLDIPLQHSADCILKVMHRQIRSRDIAALLKKLRSSIPGLVLRTTFMVGFPGEKEKDYRRLLSFVKEQRFDRVGAFIFSPEPGTRAAKLKGQIEKDTAQKRLKMLMTEQKGISRSLNRSRLGRFCDVLIEGKTGLGETIPNRRGYQYYGRSWAEAPEMDGKIYVRSGKKLVPGDFLSVRIEKAWDYDLGAINIQSIE